MSSNVIRVVAVVFVVLAIVLAIVAFRMSRNYAQTASNAAAPQQAGGQPAAPQIQVVVATRPLLANQPISKDAVALEPVQIAPKDYYANVDDVVGRTPLIDIDAGAPITPRFFKENNQLARLIPPGDKAVSLKIDDVIGVGGFVRPGDVVDVLLYLRNDQGNDVKPAQARILLRDALVLAYEDRIIAPPAGTAGQKGQPGAGQPQTPGPHQRTVVVAVPDADVTRVMLGASIGELRLALHPAAPTQVAEAAAPPGAAGTGPEGAPAPAPAEISGASLAQNAAPPPTGPEADQPITMKELAALKKKLPKGAPAAVIVYRGSARSTVYP
ncbi:MAG: Flp pilus assembly protein CpaB [Nevskia sp.]|nr:Flp pilus assembly protein CpaB [Nevskia sp.]